MGKKRGSLRSAKIDPYDHVGTIKQAHVDSPEIESGTWGVGGEFPKLLFEGTLRSQYIRGLYLCCKLCVHSQHIATGCIPVGSPRQCLPKIDSFCEVATIQRSLDGDIATSPLPQPHVTPVIPVPEVLAEMHRTDKEALRLLGQCR